MTRVRILQTENSRTFLTAPVNFKAAPQKFRQVLAAYIATFSAFSMGMCLSWTSPAIPMLQGEDSLVKVTKEDISWIGSLITLGAFVGAIPAGMMANRLGRKGTLQLLALPLFLPWLLIAFCNCVYGLYLARFILGLGIGAVSVAAPMYVAELAHKSIRGTLGTFFQVQITIGLLVEYILGGLASDFRLLALVSSIPPVLFVTIFSFMPETPVYLYSKGDVDGARKSLTYFRGDDYDLEEELMRIADDIKEATVNKAKFSDLFYNKATFRGLIISLGLMVFQQLSGINAVLFYAGNIFSETGSSLAPNICAVLVGAVQLAATLMSTVLVDRAGRKILLLISASVMCISLVSLGTYFHLKQYQDLSHLNVIPILCLAIFVIVFSIGLGPIPWMMMGEIFTPKAKGLASSISAAFNWILAFTVTNQFQNMTHVLGIGVAFIIFGVVCGVGSIFVAAMVPETKGKTANEVQDILSRQTCRNRRDSREGTTPV